MDADDRSGHLGQRSLCRTHDWYGPKAAKCPWPCKASNQAKPLRNGKLSPLGIPPPQSTSRPEGQVEHWWAKKTGSDVRQVPVMPHIKGDAAILAPREETAQTTSKTPVDVFTLGTLDRTSLLEMWKLHCRTPVPHGISQPLLRRLVAWEIQEQAEGGLTATELERLAELAAGRTRPTSSQMATGTPYLRE